MKIKVKQRRTIHDRFAQLDRLIAAARAEHMSMPVERLLDIIELQHDLILALGKAVYGASEGEKNVRTAITAEVEGRAP